MSFISDVKKEIISKLKKTLNDEDCLSFLYGLFKTIGEISLKDNTICFIANNADIFSAINLALSKLGLMEGEIEIEDENFKNSNKYKIVIDKNSSKFLLQNFIYETDFAFNKKLVKTENQKIAFLKATFLSCGTGNILLEKETSGYLIEFCLLDESIISEIAIILSEFDIFAKVISRRQQFVLYINKFELICDLFALMGAANAVLQLNNENAIREMRNNINRQNNCFEANVSKTISASLKQIDAINFIDETIGLNSLDENLQEICLLRLANKEESLDNLVKLLNGKITKSGLNHRLNKIIKISEELKGKF